MTTKYLEFNITIDNLYKMKNDILDNPLELRTVNFINTYYQTEISTFMKRR
jgi:hypothetical protein